MSISSKMYQKGRAVESNSGLASVPRHRNARKLEGFLIRNILFNVAYINSELAVENER